MFETFYDLWKHIRPHLHAYYDLGCLPKDSALALAEDAMNSDLRVQTQSEVKADLYEFGVNLHADYAWLFLRFPFTADQYRSTCEEVDQVNLKALEQLRAEAG